MFARLSLRAKIAAGPLIATCGFCALLALGLGLGGRSIQAISEIERRHYPLVKLNRDFEGLLDNLQYKLRDAVTTEDVGAVKDADLVRDQFLAHLQRAREAQIVSEAEFLSLRMKFSRYYVLARSASLQLILTGFDEATVANLNQMRRLYNRLREDLESRTQSAEIEIALQFEATRDSQKNFIRILIGVLILCTGTLFFLSRLTVTSVARPLQDLINFVERARQGDLTAPVQTSANAGGADEIAQLQLGFGSMIESLRIMVADTSASALGLTETAQLLIESGVELNENANTQERALEQTTVSMGLVQDAAADSLANSQSLADQAKLCQNSVSELNRSIGRAAGSIDQRFQEVQLTTSAVADLTRTIPDIAQGAQHLRTEMEAATSVLSEVEKRVEQASRAAALAEELSIRVSVRANEGLMGVDETDSSMREIQQGLQQLAGIVETLSSRSLAIGEITKVIDSLADETSLLALNASIISAQSGVHGRSFAVVASEMRNLARRTASSTGEIRDLVDEVQSVIAQAVGATDAGQAQVRNGVVRTSAARELLHEIREASGACIAQIEHIVAESGDQQSDIALVGEVMRAVEQTSLQFESMVEEQNHAAQDVHRGIEKTNDFAKLVRSTSREQRIQCEKLADVAEEVAAGSDEIARLVGEQDTQSERVMEALVNLAEAVQGNRARAEQIQEAVAGLSERSQRLDRNVAKFRT